MSQTKALIWGGLMLLSLVGCDEKPASSPNPAKVTEAPFVAADLPTDGQILAGKKAHDANCISCHDSAVYTRPERRVMDFPALVAQVRRCDANLATRLYDEEIQQIALYLNQAYYQFKP